MSWRAVSSAVRASGLHPEGPQFKSEIAHHFTLAVEVVFSPIDPLFPPRPTPLHESRLSIRAMAGILCT